MASPDATQGKNVQQKQEKSKNEWLLQDHPRVVGKPEVIVGPLLPTGFERKTTIFRPGNRQALSAFV
jgi:hypothetical protein